MDYQKLELRLAQLEKALYNTRTNKYSDPKKEKYHLKVISLVTKIKENDFSTFSVYQLDFYRYFIDIIFQWVEFLDNSTLNLIPFEIVSCLQKVLEDWIPDHNDYTILTSLTNKLDDYSFQYINDSQLDIYISHAKTKYGIDISEKLIQINLPKYLVFDYLASVVLYHELGHFIERKYDIVERIFNEEQQLKSLDEQLKEMYKSHFREFFCDLFAAQYVGESSNHYLSFIAYNAPAIDTHPSTSDRLSVVSDFLKNIDNSTVSVLKEATLKTTKQELKIRFKEVSKKDFENLIPIIIKEDAELHALFVIGWKIWLDKNCSLKKKFDGNKLYSVINNLIEKSISNYLITTSWNKHNVPN